MKLHLSGALLGALLSTAAFAQTAPLSQPAIVQPAPAPASPEAESNVPAVAADAQAELPANTEVILTVNSEINTKTHKLADKFSMTVAQDVRVGDRIVIPKGTRAVGQLTQANDSGSFGKSGKMELTFRYLDLAGKQIPIEGKHWQEGQGNTAATVGAVVAAGVIGGLIVKGKNASIAEGREFTARTMEAIPVTLPASEGAPAAILATYTPTPVSMQVETKKERKAREKLEKATAAKKNRT